jgi:hypothetical protein
VDERPDDEVRQPRSEPEIIPPSRARRRGAGDPGPRLGFEAGGFEPRGFEPGGFEGGGFERVRVFRLRPLTALLTALALGGVALALVVILLGAVLVALPVIGAIVAVGLLTALLRGARRQLP